MNKEDIIRMAREACDQAPREDWNSTAWVFGDETLERFAALVAAHEREACANLLLNVDLSPMDADHRLQSWTATVLLNFSDAIRARGEQ
jgi:putative NIF3 family GTP cyclohydrolase 1 type 2